MPKETHAIPTETLGEHAPSYATVKNWVAQFKRGDFSTCVAPRHGRPKTVTTPESIDQIHELILEDQRISAKSIAEHLGISRERVGSIIHEDLYMRELSAKWVPKCMNADQKRQRCQSSEQLLDCNNEWSGGIAAHPAPKKFRVQKSSGKVLAPIFLGSRRHHPHSLSFKGPNYQRGLLLISAGAIEGHFEGKTPRGGKVTKGGLFLHDSAPAHRALASLKKLAYLGFQCLDHPPYSPDLAPSDYHLFAGLKEQLKGRHFSSDAEVIAARGDLAGRTTL